jgi:3-hexulose-6-phosphate synthase
MKLQIAIDTVRSDKALIMVDKIYDIIDIVEIGTPMIVREGMKPVEEIKAKYPAVTLLADTKIVDGGEIESTDAFTSGADIVTVLAFADDSTIKAVVEAAKKFHGKVMADMICIQDIETRAQQLDALGVDFVCIHTAVDVQTTGKTPFKELSRLTKVIDPKKSAVAGGVKLSTIKQAKEFNPGIVVIGSALTNASDLRKAVQAILAEMKS